jgi:hypothetical protein
MTRIAFALLPLWALAFSGAAADSPAAEGSGGTAIVLFLAYEGPAHPPFDTSVLHSRAWDRLVGVARERGIDAQSRAALEPLLYKWRVRNSLGISSGFVEELSSRLHCPQILVADLTVYSDRLILMAHRTDTETGELVSAGIAEAPFGLENNAAPDVEKIIERGGAASASLLQGLKDRAPAEADHEIFFLPTRRSGIDAAAANLAGCCILQALLRTTWRIEDPGIAFTRLCAAGLNPTALDPKAGPELAGPGRNAAILIGELASYGLPSGGGPLLEGSETPVTQLQFPSVALSLRSINAQTGSVVFASTEYVEPPQLRGLFGLARTSSLTRCIQPAADRLVAKIKG